MKIRFSISVAAVAVCAVLASAVPLFAQARNSHKQQTQYIVIDLGTLGGSQGVAEGISNTGFVAGDATLLGDQSVHAAVWRDSKVTDLGTLGGVNSQEQWPVTDSQGVIVGSSETAQFDPFKADFCGFDSNSGGVIQYTGLICLGDG